LSLSTERRFEPATKLTIGRYGDVSFETDWRPRELLQTKHHIRGVGNLGDRSRDLWRTLRVWIDAVQTGAATLAGATFSLLTTAIAPDGSAASSSPISADGIADAFLAAGAIAAVGSLLALVVLPSARSFLPKLRLAPSSMPTH
jgi:hypothetical protein